jgi:hypothetical protein
MAGLDLHYRLPGLNVVVVAVAVAVAVVVAAAAVGVAAVGVAVAAADVDALVGGRLIRLCEPGLDSLPTIESPTDANAAICCCRCCSRIPIDPQKSQSRPFPR